MRMVGFDIFAPSKEQVRDCRIWRENWESVAFFAEYCLTQWVHVGIGGGMGGGALLATGLNHASVVADLKTLRLSDERFDAVYADVRLMEREALQVMSAKHAK